MNTKLDDFLDGFEEAAPVVKTNRTLYFDETNNIKKGIISDIDNVEDLENTYFVLGGIGTNAKLDFDELLNFIGGKQKPTDAKFKYFSCGKSSFLDAIKQPRLSKLFQYLFEHRIIIHFDVLHYLHFALTDILDSLITENDANQQAAFYFYKQLQSDMTEVLFVDYDRLHNLLCNYEFPNIPKEKANDFVNELFNMYEDNLWVFDNENPDYFTKELLRQIIKAKRDKKTLYFLEGNKPFVISEKMSFFYISRMANFKCKKYFDEEGDIIRDVEEMDSNYKEKLNVEFISSKDNREIQVSDAISGFVGRLYNFLSHNSEQQIYSFANSLNIDSIEFATLKWFFKLMTISDKETNIYFEKVTPLFIERRFNLLVKIIEKKNS